MKYQICQELQTVNDLCIKTKSKLIPLANSIVVYCVLCLNCDLSHTGQVSRCLSGHIISDKTDCNLNRMICALAEHVIKRSMK